MSIYLDGRLARKTYDRIPLIHQLTQERLHQTLTTDDVTDEDIQDIALTINTTPRKCLGFKSPIEAFLNELGKSVTMRFYPNVALRS